MKHLDYWRIKMEKGIDLKDLKRGMQIMYAPDHADTINSRAIERGFVTSINDKVAFCRYWNDYIPSQLRTKVNSEATSPRDLIIVDSVPQAQVEKALEEYCSQ